MKRIFYDGVEYRCFDHIYAVSRDGKFLRHGKPFGGLRPHPQGYLTVGRRRLAHRVVAACWCDRPEGADTVHHVNHDKTDNRAENLEWTTQSEHVRSHHPRSSAGHRMSEAGKARLRALRLGSTAPDSVRQKLRDAMLRLGHRPPPRPKGSKMGDAFRAKCSQNSANAQRCVIDGVAYASFNEAGAARGEKPHSLRKRCLSPNFPNYRLGSI